jgi:hypothetical protein
MNELEGFSPLMGKLAQAMVAECEPLDAPPEHLFAPGIYARVLKMPAGSIIISKIHKTEHFCVALSGRATVVREDGAVREEIEGPRIMRTLPGTQRALYIHEDAVWVTFHVTDKTDVDEIEKDIIAKGFNDPVLVEYRQRQIGVET